MIKFICKLYFPIVLYLLVINFWFYKRYYSCTVFTIILMLTVYYIVVLETGIIIGIQYRFDEFPV